MGRKGRKGDERSFIKPNKGGRPTKLTPELQLEIVRNLEHGAYQETAAAAAGVHADTFRLWLREGKKRPNSVYAKFLMAVDQAVAKAQLADLEAISKHRAKNWQAPAWRVSRRDPKRWGPASRGRVGDDGDDGDDSFTLNYNLEKDEGP